MAKNNLLGLGVIPASEVKPYVDKDGDKHLKIAVPFAYRSI
jgi:hypothetical protein